MTAGDTHFPSFRKRPPVTALVSSRPTERHCLNPPTNTSDLPKVLGVYVHKAFHLGPVTGVPAQSSPGGTLGTARDNGQTFRARARAQRLRLV